MSQTTIQDLLDVARSKLVAKHATIQARLIAETDKLDPLQTKAEVTHRTSLANHIGGSTFDHGALSGVRRQPNRKADQRRFNAYSREAAAHSQLSAQASHVESLEHRLSSLQAILDSPAVTEADLKAAKAIRTEKSGWEKVVRVNRKTVTVTTEYSWTLPINIDQIIGVLK